MVAFVDIVNHLESQQEQQKIALFAQEPNYTPTDQAFLTLRGWEVPATCHGTMVEARQHLKPGTVVYEPFMESSQLQVLLMPSTDIRLYIGSSPKLWYEHSTHGNSDGVRKSYYFPRFEEDPNVFEGMQIAWTESNSDQEI